LEVVEGQIITETTALRIKARQTFEDIYGVSRKAGEEWLVTRKHSSEHIVDVYEQLVGVDKICVIREDEFCYIQDPVDD
jgi:major vault protein